MGFKMNGSPAKLGTIQGTSGYASALKQVKELSQVEQLKEYEAKQKLDKLKKDAAKKAKKKAKKKATKKELKEKGVKDEAGRYILGEMERGDTKYDPKKDYSKPDPDLNLSKKAAKKAEKKNKKILEKQIQYEEEHKEVKPSEKTRRLREKSEKVSGKLKTADEDKKWWRSDKRRKRRLGRKEDRLARKLERSEAFDALTPEQKVAKQRERMAYLTAMFNDDARTMYLISQKKDLDAKAEDDTEGVNYLSNYEPFTDSFKIHGSQMDLTSDVGKEDLPEQEEGQV